MGLWPYPLRENNFAYAPNLSEVAFALVKLILKSPRPADALLLHTILSTPLVALKRRGFNVDRITRQRRVERLAQEEADMGRAAELEKFESMAKELEEVSFPPSSLSASPC